MVFVLFFVGGGLSFCTLCAQACFCCSSQFFKIIFYNFYQFDHGTDSNTTGTVLISCAKTSRSVLISCARSRRIIPVIFFFFFFLKSSLS